MKQVQSRLSWSRLPLLMSVLVLLILAGCATTATPTGSLEITITGLPDDQTADIGVNGPGNYGATLAKDTTLSGLTPGDYTVRARIITVTAVEFYVATIAPPSATVAAKKTATVEVAYQRISAPAPIPGDGTGTSLVIVVSGLPDGVDAGVTVSGPEDFSQDVSTSTVLIVAPGMYTLSSDPVRTDDPIVSKVHDLDPIEVEVTSGTPASASAMYAERTGSGTLWLANQNAGDNDVLGFSAEHLAVSSTGLLVADDLTDLTVDGLEADAVVVVDGDGDLWMMSPTTTTLWKYDVSLDAPEVTMIMELPAGPASGAFDSSGSLWIAATSTVVEFSKDQLAKAEADDADALTTPTPNVTITGFTSPAGVAFDAAGNLWVANADTVVMFSPAQLAADDTEVLDAVTIRADGVGDDRSLNGPTGVAFDAAGNLWVSSTGNSTVVKFTPAQLAASGNPAPDVTISANARAILGTSVSLNSPEGLAFDNSGDLWVANVPSNADDGSLVRFSGVGDLSGAVSPDPATTIATNPGLGLSSPAFSPSDLPILP